MNALRGAIGIHVARLVAAYGLDAEDDLASILPEADDQPQSGRSERGFGPTPDRIGVAALQRPAAVRASGADGGAETAFGRRDADPVRTTLESRGVGDLWSLHGRGPSADQALSGGRSCPV